MREDKQIRLVIECDCHEPFHVICFEYVPREIVRKDNGEILCEFESWLRITGQVGWKSIKQRIITAWKLLLHGRAEEEIDIYPSVKENIDKLRAFLETVENREKEDRCEK